MSILNLILTTLLGGYTAFLSNRGIALLQHDVRSSYREYEEKNQRKELLQLSFKIALPLLLGLALPLSIATWFLSGYIILLGGELIGLLFPRTKKGMILSAVAGAISGAGVFALFYLFRLYVPGLFSIDFLTPLKNSFQPLTNVFALIPAFAIGIHFGAKKSIAACLLLVIVYIAVLKIGTFSFVSGNLSAIGISFIFGSVLYYLLTLKEKKIETEVEELTSEFASEFPRIKKNLPYLVISGAFIALNAASANFALDPLSQALFISGFRFEAGWAVVIMAISSIMVLWTTAKISGIYSPIGSGLCIALGYWAGAIPGVYGLVAASLLGGGIIALEIIGAQHLMHFFYRNQSLITMGKNLKKASMTVMDYTIFVGSMLVANIIYPVVGYMWVLSVWIIHRSSAKKPFHPIIVGPIAVLIMGLLVNILRLLKILI